MGASASKQSIDFTNVKEGGNFSKKHMPAGDYLAKITKVEDAMPKDKSDKTPMWLFTIQLKNTPSATYPYYCKLQENQLWKVRNLLVAAGINVPKKKVAVDPNRLIGKLVAVSLDDTEYNGKDQSEIGAVFSPSDLDGDTGAEEDDDVDEPDEDDTEEEDEEEAPAPKKSKKSKAPEPEEDEDDDDEDEEPEPPKKKKKKAEPEPEPEEEDDDEDEDEEPEPPKKKKKSKKERAAAKAAAAAAADDEDDDEIDIEDLD